MEGVQMVEKEKAAPGTINGTAKEHDEGIEFLFNDPTFPIRIYPESIQRFIEATQKGLNFPKDYIGASVLFAVAASIGNSIRVEVMPGWIESAVLYLALVGNPGTSKSHPLSFVMKPIEEIDSLNFEKYKKQKREYDENITLSKKERKEKGLSDFPVKPNWQQTIVSDYTPEALADTHKFNQRGIAVVMDELVALVKNFDRYSKGSEQEFILSAWSCKPVRISRKTTEPTYLPLPFISIAGTIQPSVVAEMAKNRTENGFIDRILFAFPDRVPKLPWGIGVSPEWPAYWNNTLNKIIGIPFNTDSKGNPTPRILKFTSDGLRRLKRWQAELAHRANTANNEAQMGLLAKLEVYAIRFSLCLEVLRSASTESDLTAIGIESVEGAISLTNYFRRNGEKVHSLVSKGGIPEAKEVIKLLHSLGHNQTQIGKILKVSQPYVSRILNN